PGTLQELISQTMVHWAQESFIQSPELVRAMFSLLHRQYDGLGELVRALPKAYTISARSLPDTAALLHCLAQIRSLLIVQMGPEEENLMIQSIGWPRGSLCPPTGTPGSPMSPRLASWGPCALKTGAWGSLCPSYSTLGGLCAPKLVPWGSPCPQSGTLGVPMSPNWHFGVPAPPKWLLGDPFVPQLAPWGPPMRAPRASPWCEPPAQVVTYLASCGLQSCPMLLAKGYPDIGWNPCGGERYLDFLRFAVFVNGESVEENANVVVRLLIR
ncbi:RYR1 protein, partial [Trogon melanurus]|nr:RYR1 protein [Trogon melanurus]